MMLVMVKGSVIDETPVDASIPVLKKKHENARQRVENGGF
jgi:hypothetical protein